MMVDVLQGDRSEDHPRKRLLTDPNSKASVITESPESTVSFDSSSDRFAKKTRELPNLSDCHSCGVRINHTNPRERLQPLDSLWRIVLLCKKCTKRVNSSDICTYCFSAVVDDNDCFKCRSCHHSVHKLCVAQYGSGLGFSVCVDCWVPDVVAKSIRARNRKFRKKNNESCGQIVTLPKSMVCFGEMERKDTGAAKGSENALRKAVVAKGFVRPTKVVLGIAASRKVAAGCEAKGAGDAELAFLLRRAINNSSRISRYACLVSSFRRDNAQMICYSRRSACKKIVLMDSSSMDVPLICYYRRRQKGCLRASESLNAPLICYSRRGSGSKACSQNIECECFICSASKKTDKQGSVSSAGLKEYSPSSNSENSLSRNKCQETDGERIETKPYRHLLKYYRIGKGTPRPPNMYTEDMPDTRNYGNDNEYPEFSENNDDDTNRFLLKYKRFSRYKPKFSCKAEVFSPMLISKHCTEPSTLSNTMPISSSQKEL